MNTPKTAAELTAIILNIIADGDASTKDLIEAQLSMWEKTLRLDQLKIDQELALKLIEDSFGNGN